MKTAVSIPDVLFDAADRLARSRRMSRSALYAEALQLLLDTELGEDEVTARLDAVHADHDIGLDPAIVAANVAFREEW